jgi:hypothetical protein
MRIDQLTRGDSDPRRWTGGTELTIAPGATVSFDRP